MKDIKKIIIEEFLDSDVKITDSTSLFRENVLDSVDLVQLVAILEEEFDITVSPREIIPSNFDTPDAIAKFIKEKE